MLAYFVIAIELSILYTVFWYVFLREPKPYRIKGNAWGSYDGPKPEIKGFAMFGGNAPLHGKDCGCPADKEAKQRSASASAIYQEWNTSSTSGTYNQIPQVPLTAGELIRSQTRGVERVAKEMPINSRTLIDYAPHNPAEQYRNQSKTIPAFLAKLGDRLNLINVKIP